MERWERLIRKVADLSCLYLHLSVFIFNVWARNICHALGHETRGGLEADNPTKLASCSFSYFFKLVLQAFFQPTYVINWNVFRLNHKGQTWLETKSFLSRAASCHLLALNSASSHDLTLLCIFYKDICTGYFSNLIFNTNIKVFR